MPNCRLRHFLHGGRDATRSQGTELVTNGGGISGLVSEDEFLDFAGGGAEDGGEDEVGGNFVGGEVLSTPLLQLLGADLHASGEFDEGAGGFAPFLDFDTDPTFSRFGLRLNR